MSSLRFSQTNYIKAATLKNGTGGGAPALDEVSPWVTTNAQTADRTILWQNSGGTSMQVDFDLGSDKSVGVVAILGHRGFPNGTAGITSAALQYAAAAAGYLPGAWSTFTGSPVTLGATVRDAGLFLSSPVTARYLRFDLTVSTTFTVGRFFAGAIEVDLGKLYSPGRTRRRVDPDMRNEGSAQFPTVTITGDPFYLYQFPYEDEDASLRTSLESVAALGRAGTFVMHDGGMSTIHECVMDSSQGYGDEHLFDYPDRFNATLAIRTLG